MTSLVAAGALALASFAATAPAEAHHRHGHPIFAGVAGFALGAVVGSALTAPRPVYVAPQPIYVAPQPVYVAPAQWTPAWYAYCADKFGSFDARSGTYLGYDGYRHMCQ